MGTALVVRGRSIKACAKALREQQLAVGLDDPECRIAIAALRHVVSVRCNLRCAAQILEHVLGFRRSRAFTQEIIRGAQGAYLFSDRGRDELVQRAPPAPTSALSALGIFNPLEFLLHCLLTVPASRGSRFQKRFLFRRGKSLNDSAVLGRRHNPIFAERSLESKS
jgi:hypothetical protein